ncbi:hypothetical protein PPTG_07563 [Phytophthora nicotianae INRA-310]|uniref:Uncharacterized protein n=2 Tax=Phytophthora nicotianae TaxID=4792 RepID=W2QNI1_PHYN3|nr:hypothetical protein PPTG_07563 [Phytophthora nicotianae INRA-310]ETN14526.1 hypothetical protein PPTG_07563 [Phytophthora nicotianae INRA-310]
MDKIRKECTLRELKLHSRTNTSKRIKVLCCYDKLFNSGEGTIAASAMASGSTRCTKHYMSRLLNVLMSDELVKKLVNVTGKGETLIGKI